MPEQQRAQELEGRIGRLEKEESISKSKILLKCKSHLKVLANRSKPLFNLIRNAGASRIFAFMLRFEGFDIGRFKVLRLIQEVGLINE
ncbi:hypothetical protein L1D34_28110 [Vibrio mediterranei]|uniref:hypothetical protein n=1 Tax=Vibrio mediterranei TaxID=689 RepID=UPI001EFDA82F|nr:hypothetical protein [Vibrio mediterranei]MCG9628677.1 hypothetical protein [Vibrio mediterranei]